MSKISEWCVNDMPITKMAEKGKYSLSDTEILSMIIGAGNVTGNSVEIARKLLFAYGFNIDNMSKATTKELQRIDGIGKAKASAIVAAFELGRRRSLNEAFNVTKITNSKDIFEIFKPILSDLKHEEFWILLLNRGNKIIARKQISSGGISGTVADPKIIFKYALDEMASSIALCHNHPSGANQPSEADNRLTKKITDGGVMLDIVVLDHVIIAQNEYFSYADEGKM